MTYITLAIAEHRQHGDGDAHAGDTHTGREPEESEAHPAPGTA